VNWPHAKKYTPDYHPPIVPKAQNTIDQFIGNTSEFPVLAHVDYLNHAGISPWPTRVIERVREASSDFGTHVYLPSARDNHFARIEVVRAAVAQLINAKACEIAFVQNTGQALSIVAGAMSLSPGDRIISASAEYPSNIYPWMAIARATGAELVTIPTTTGSDGAVRVSTNDVLREISHRRTRVVALSHVQWATGELTDIKTIGEACHGFGVGFVVDAIQSMGVVPIDVRALHIDAIAAGSHKWLLSPGGAGVLWMREELIADAVPNHVGWNSVVNPHKYEDIRFELRPCSQRFEPGTLPMLSILGLGAALELLLEVGIENVFEQVRVLNSHFRNGIENLGAIIATPADACAGSTCFTLPGWNSDQLVSRLRKDHNIEFACRGGQARFSPHFYNTMDQADRAVNAISQLRDSLIA